jgi:8-oxo-dGTP pyrophosphatase MutT (NUDIX family)
MSERRAFSVAVFCRNGDAVLLIRHRRLGTWLPVGGEIEAGETPLEAARRELREETGLEVEPLDFLGTWMDRYGGDSTAEATLNMYWTARAVGGEPAPADDVDELRWFARDELPGADELAFENVPLVLAAWREHGH